MCRLAMRGIKSFGIGLERAEAGFGAKVNRAPAVFSPWKILRIGMMEDPPAEGHKMR